GADAAGVGAKQPQLKLLGQLLGDRARDKATEARVDAVGVLARAVRGALHELARGLHLSACRVRKAGPLAVDGHRPDVADRQVVPRQRDPRALRHEVESKRSQPSSNRSSSTRVGSKPSILSIAPAAATAAPAGMSPTSSEPATSTPRARASTSTRARISCRA